MLTIVIGAQYGGEGKGKVCSALALINELDISCRSGGVNSSHTVKHRGREFRLRMLPAASVVNSKVEVVYGAGSLLHIPTLFNELRELGINGSLVRIDPNAGVVDDETIAEQRADSRYQAIGSTLTGTGYASAKRCQRILKLAKDYAELKPFLSEVPMWIYERLNGGANVLIEGHQGVGLSNYHGDYPYTSSRDCIAASLLSEIGIGLRHETKVILAVKVFPTRNHGGNLPNEMNEASARLLGISEKGGGSWGISDNIRRVAGLDFDDIRRAVALNQPSYLAITGIDYLDHSLRDCTDRVDVSADIEKFIVSIEREVGVPVGLLSTGPDAQSVIVWNPELVSSPSERQRQAESSLQDSA